ncbi:hypothetical protein Hanom_Chr17g01567361 [Helianthus anomalus]
MLYVSSIMLLQKRERERVYGRALKKEEERRRKGRAGQSTAVSHAGSWLETVVVVSFTPISDITWR